MYVKNLLSGCNCKIADDELYPAPRHAPIRLGHGLPLVSHVSPLQIAPISPSLRRCRCITYAIRMLMYKFTRNCEEGTEFHGGRHGCFHGYYPCGWGSLLPILSHMGLGRRAHLGIRHMVNKVGFVIWPEKSGGEHPGADMSKNQKQVDLSHRGLLL